MAPSELQSKAMNSDYSPRTEPSERRASPRYRCSVAVSFSWKTSAGEWRHATGISRDISACGILVVSSSLPVPGSPIELTVNLPVSWARTTQLRGHGLVVRLHPVTGQPWGFAAILTFEEELHEDLSELASEAESDDRRSGTDAKVNRGPDRAAEPKF